MSQEDNLNVEIIESNASLPDYLKNNFITSSVDVSEDQGAILQMEDIENGSSSNKTKPTTSNDSTSNILMMELSPEESSPLKETLDDPFSSPKWFRYLNGIYMLIIGMIVLAFILTVALIVQSNLGVREVYPHGAVISSNSECSKLGKDFLSEPLTSSVDAAILTSLCLSILHPHASSIGGGGYMIVYNLRGRLNDSSEIDFREMSGERLTEDLLKNFSSASLPKGLKVAVPGTIKGLFEAHQRYGRRNWKEIMMRANHLALKGGFVSPELGSAISDVNLSSLSSDLQNLITNQIGSKLNVNDRLPPQKQLASLFKNLSSSGIEAFYESSFTNDLIKKVELLGGVLTADDFTFYKPIASPKPHLMLFNSIRCVIGKGSMFGSVVHYIIGLLESSKTSKETFNGTLQLHQLIESIKFGMGKLSQGFNFSSADKFPTIKTKSVYPLKNYLEGFQPLTFKQSTRQFVTTLGPDYIAVSLVMSLGSSFGSGIIQSGVVLNDAVTDFSWPQKNPLASGKISKTNLVRPRSRPISSLLPMITIPKSSQCGTYHLVGESGTGDTSLAAVTRVLLDLSFGKSFNFSISAFRLFPIFENGTSNVYIEEFAPKSLVENLSHLGHHVIPLSQNQTHTKSFVCGITRHKKGSFILSHDKRMANDSGYFF